MSRAAFPGCLLVVVLCVGCGGRSATATVEARSGGIVAGSGVFKESGGAVNLSVELTGVPPGEHGLHIHTLGDCTSADALSAGGHWNPTSVGHGELGVTPEAHLGDIGNVTANAGGDVVFAFSTDQWTIGDGAFTDVVGKALIVHGAPDDFSQPTGSSGNRIGCGVIELTP